MWIETEEAKVSVGRSRGVLERKCKTKVPCNKKSRQLFIPEEIVFHILMWLPANILFNCMRYVCRQWYSIVSSPQFIEQHFLHHSTITTTTGFLFEVVHEKRGLRLINYGGVTRMDFPHYDMICASCDGLVVVNHPVAGIHVVNPLTRQVIRLPAFREPLLKTCSSFSLVRCASKNSCYKVFVSYTSEFNNLTLKCAIVEVGKGCSWKYFNYPDGHGLKHTLCVGSIIYWSMPRSIVDMVECSFAEASRVSVGFDVESETFFHNPFSAAAAALEEEYKENKCFIVESGDGKSLSLLVCLERRNVFDVWLMSNACDPKSGFKWKKHCRIDLGFVAVSEKYIHSLWVPEVWVNNGDVVVFRNGSGVFVAYNVKAGRTFRFGREHGYHPTSRGFVSGFGFSMVKPSSSC